MKINDARFRLIISRDNAETLRHCAHIRKLKDEYDYLINSYNAAIAALQIMEEIDTFADTKGPINEIQEYAKELQFKFKLILGRK